MVLAKDCYLAALWARWMELQWGYTAAACWGGRKDPHSAVSMALWRARRRVGVMGEQRAAQRVFVGVAQRVKRTDFPQAAVKEKR